MVIILVKLENNIKELFECFYLENFLFFCCKTWDVYQFDDL